VRHVVVPARTSAEKVTAADRVKPPPATAVPAIAVVIVVIATAWPVPDPAPVAWKTVPTLLLAAFIAVQVVVPENIILYQTPVTKFPAVIGALSPLGMTESIVT
jgi:hypothetical protein